MAKRGVKRLGKEAEGGSGGRGKDISSGNGGWRGKGGALVSGMMDLLVRVETQETLWGQRLRFTAVAFAHLFV